MERRNTIVEQTKKKKIKKKIDLKKKPPLRLVVEGKVTKTSSSTPTQTKMGKYQLKKNQKTTTMHNKEVPKNNINE